MTENPYAVPLDEFVGRSRIPVSDVVEVHAEPGTTTDLDWSTGSLPAGGGGDGGCD